MVEVDIKKFAERVERLCDFLLSKMGEEVGRTGSNNQKVLEDLKEDAARIQFEAAPFSEAIEGLHDYMHGIPPEVKNEE